jgi:hypothetical protein
LQNYDILINGFNACLAGKELLAASERMKEEQTRDKMWAPPHSENRRSEPPEWIMAQPSQSTVMPSRLTQRAWEFLGTGPYDPIRI